MQKQFPTVSLFCDYFGTEVHPTCLGDRHVDTWPGGPHAHALAILFLALGQAEPIVAPASTLPCPLPGASASFLFEDRVLTAAPLWGTSRTMRSMATPSRKPSHNPGNSWPWISWTRLIVTFPQFYPHFLLSERQVRTQNQPQWVRLSPGRQPPFRAHLMSPLRSLEASHSSACSWVSAKFRWWWLAPLLYSKLWINTFCLFSFMWSSFIWTVVWAGDSGRNGWEGESQRAVRRKKSTVLQFTTMSPLYPLGYMRSLQVEALIKFLVYFPLC